MLLMFLAAQAANAQLPPAAPPAQDTSRTAARPLANRPVSIVPKPGTRFLPEPAEIAGDDRLIGVLAAREALGFLGDQPEVMLATIDQQLLLEPRPTPLRGYLLYLRGSALVRANRLPEARKAFEESIASMPGWSAPLLAAVSMDVYSPQFQVAADHLLRAAEIDPVNVKGLGSRDIDALLHRLDLAGEDRRIEALGSRLLAIGWEGDRISSVSQLARMVIERKIRLGDVAGARSLVPRIRNPLDSFELLSLREAAPVWADLEQHGGPRLAPLWRSYLAATRARLQETASPSAIDDHLGALEAAGHDRTYLQLALPIYADVRPNREQQLLFRVATTASVMMRQGRLSEVDRFFDQAQRAWPLGLASISLNVPVNRATFRQFTGDDAGALVLIEQASADARRWGDQVSRDALATIEARRSCILRRLNRTDEASAALERVNQLGVAASSIDAHLCSDDLPAARQLLLDGLARPSDRRLLSRFVLPRTEAFRGNSEYLRWISDREDALRNDPAVRAAAESQFRLLPYTLRDGAPAEAKP